MESNSWCKPATKAAALEWLKSVLATCNLDVGNYRDLKDGHVLYRLLQLIQQYSSARAYSRRNIPARPCARFAKINEFIQGAVKVGSIYGLNVGAILNHGDEQELCKAVVLMLFVGSLVEGSPILAAGVSLSAEHQFALQEILKIVQNKPEPDICLESSPMNTTSVHTTPPGASGSCADPRLAAVASVTVADSPLLAQLMESPFTSSKRQSVYSQLRKLRLKVLGLEDERDMVLHEKKKATTEMGGEINELKAQLTNLQNLLSSYYSEEDYRALEERVASLQHTNTKLGEELAEMAEVKDRIKLLESVTDSDTVAIERLQKENKALVAEMTMVAGNWETDKEEVERMHSVIDSLQNELTETKTALIGKEEENSSLIQMMAGPTSSPDTPNMNTEENMGDLLLMEAQGEIGLLKEQLEKFSELQCLSSEKLECLNSELEKARHQIDLSESKCVGLQSDLCAKTEMSFSLQTRLKATQEEFAQFSIVKEKELKELTTLKLEFEDSASKLQQEMMKELELTTKKLENAGIRIQDLEQCNKKYSSSITNMEEQLTNKDQANSLLRQKVQEVEDKAENELAEWSLERVSLLQNVNRLEVQVNKQQDKADHFGSSVKTLEKQLEELQQCYSRSEEKVISLTEKWTTANLKLEAGCNTISTLEKVNEVQENRLELMKNEKDELVESINRLQRDLKEQSANIAEADKKIDELTAALSSTEMYNERQKGVFEAREISLESKLQTTSAELKLAREANDSVKVELAELVQAHSSLKDVLDNTEAQHKLAISCLADTVENLQCKVGLIAEEKTELTQQSAKLREALNVAEHSNAIKEQQQSHEISRLQSIIQDKSQLENDLQLEIEQLTLSNRSLLEKCDANTGELFKANMRYEEVEWVFNATTQSLLHTNERNSDLTHQLDQLCGQIRLLQSFIETGNLSRVDSLSGMQPYLSALDTLQREYASQKQQLDSALATIQSNSFTITELENTRSQQRELLGQEQTAAAKLRQHQVDQQTRISELERENLCLSATREHNESQLSLFESRELALKSKLHTTSTELQLTQEANDSIKVELAELVQAHSSLKDAHNNTQSQFQLTVSCLEDTVGNLQSKIEQIAEENTALAQQSTKLQEEFSIAERSNATKEKQLNREICRLESLIQEKSQAENDLQLEIEQLTLSNRSLSERSDAKTEELAKANMRYNEVEWVFNATTQTLLHTNERNNDLTHQLDQLCGQIRLLQSFIETDNFSRVDSLSDMQPYLLALNTLQREHAYQKQQLESASATIRSNTETITELENTRIQQRELLEQEQTVAAELRQHQVDQQTHISELERENLYLTEHPEMVQMQLKIDELESALSATKEDNEREKGLFETRELSLEDKLQTMSAELQLAQEANDSMKVELAELVQAHSSLEDVLSETEAQHKLAVSCLEDTVENLQCNVEQIVEENTTLAQRLAQLQEALNNAEHSNATNEKQQYHEICRLESLIQNKSQLVNNLQSEIEQLTVSNRSLSEKYDAKTEELAKANMRYEEVEWVFNATTQTLMHTNERNSDLTNQLDQLCGQIRLLQSFIETDNLSCVDSLSDMQPYLLALDTLQREHAYQKQQLESASATIRSNAETITELEHTHIQQRELLEQEQTVTAELQQHQVDQQTRISGLERENLYLTEHPEMVQMQLKIDELESALSATKEDNERQKGLFETRELSLEDKLQNTSAELQLAQEANDLVKVELAELVQAHSSLEDVLVETKAQHKLAVSCLEDTVENLQCNIERIAKENTTLAQQSTKLQEALNVVEHSNATNEQQQNHEICKLKLLIQDKSQAENDLQMKIEQLTLSNRSLSKTCDAKAQELAKASMRYEEVEWVFNATTQTLLHTNERNSDLIHQLDQLCGQIKLLQSYNETSLLSRVDCLSDMQPYLSALDILQRESVSRGQQLDSALATIQNNTETIAQLENTRMQQRELLEQEQTAAAELRQHQIDQQTRISELKRENLQLLERSETVKTELKAAIQSNKELEYKLVSFNETSEILERYKVSYKEKKVTIEKLNHELKLSKALGDKYKEDCERFKARYESLQNEIKAVRQMEHSLRSTLVEAPSSINVDDTVFRVEELETTLREDRNVSKGQRPLTAETQRCRSFLKDTPILRPLGDDESDVMISGIIQPKDRSNMFTEAASANALLGSSTMREEDPNDRIAELKRRNARYLPHMRSAYPIESQTYTPSKPQSEEIRQAKDAASLTDSRSTVRQTNRNPREKSENIDRQSVVEQSVKRSTDVSNAKAAATPSRKIFSPIENEVTNTATSTPSAPDNLRNTMTFMIENTPKQRKKPSLKGKLKSALPGTKK